MEVSSTKKKFKDKKFAAGCLRDIIRQGAETWAGNADQYGGCGGRRPDWAASEERPQKADAGNPDAGLRRGDDFYRCEAWRAWVSLPGHLTGGFPFPSSGALSRRPRKISWRSRCRTRHSGSRCSSRFFWQRTRLPHRGACRCAARGWSRPRTDRRCTAF